jgi:hypothetical protein
LSPLGDSAYQSIRRLTGINSDSSSTLVLAAAVQAFLKGNFYDRAISNKKNSAVDRPSTAVWMPQCLPRHPNSV